MTLTPKYTKVLIDAEKVKFKDFEDQKGNIFSGMFLIKSNLKHGIVRHVKVNGAIVE